LEGLALSARLETVEEEANQMGLTPRLLQCCKRCHDEAMPILYKENRFVFHSYRAIHAFRTLGLTHHSCDWHSHIVGLDPSTTAGRFQYITNLTFNAQGWEGDREWFAKRSSNERGGLDRHMYPRLRVLNINMTAHEYPSHKLLNVEDVLESISDLEKICLTGVDILPLRLIGALRGVRSREELLITENLPCVFKRGERHWELLAEKEGQDLRSSGE
jgi:hypothetical protein